MSLFKYLDHFRIFKERERFHNKSREQADNKQTNAQLLEIKDTSYTYEGQLSTDKDDIC